MDSGDHAGSRREGSSCGPARGEEPTDVILELTNPQLEQQLQDAQLKLQAAEAGLANLKVQLNNDLLRRSAPAAQHRGRLSTRRRCRRR